jgi:DNA-directed RNA polymerase subunit RPC12/RpoP
MKITVSFDCNKCNRRTHAVTHDGHLPSVVKCEACGKKTPVGKGKP